MLQGGTDLSGSGADSDQFLGIVMGTKASISKIIEHVGCDPIKPDKTTKGRLRLCSRLEFDGKDGADGLPLANHIQFHTWKITKRLQ